MNARADAGSKQKPLRCENAAFIRMCATIGQLETARLSSHKGAENDVYSTVSVRTSTHVESRRPKSLLRLRNFLNIDGLKDTKIVRKEEHCIDRDGTWVIESVEVTQFPFGFSFICFVTTS